LTTITRQTDDDTRHPECTGYCFRGHCSAAVATGGGCSADRQCALGSHCAAHRCVDGPRPTLGETCDGDACDHDLVCIDGRCAPPKPLGASCRGPADCRATCLGATPTTPGSCATRCTDWPPAGYTPPVATATP
jgi:hypothetical protein